MPHPSSAISRTLHAVAEGQQGYFTAKQAKAAGYAENTHPYHVQAGNWVREYRGIYRLAKFPATDHPDLALWSLWSRNRKGETEGVFSHQTALSLYELSDVNPAKLHMTVPKRFRRNSEIPGVLALHYTDIEQNDVQSAQGFQFTRPLRTIADLVESGDIEQTFLQQATRQALQKGLLTRQQLLNIKPTPAMQQLLEEVLQQVA